MALSSAPPSTRRCFERLGPAGPVGSDSYARELSELAVSALIDEADLTPKPGLVDARGRGAHVDLDLVRLHRSAISLGDGFRELARSANGRPASPALREELAHIGREMELRMLVATGGANAHRGAIWALGLLVAGAAQTASVTGEAPTAERAAAAAAAIARFPDRSAPRSKSNGEQVATRFGAPGARGEARAAFPHVLALGLPTLRSRRERGVAEPHARLDALLSIMARLDDTCLLHRGGRPALVAAQSGARAVLAAGGASAPRGRALLEALHLRLMRLWASPGGSGDLLAATLFLDRLERTPHDKGASCRR